MNYKKTTKTFLQGCGSFINFSLVFNLGFVLVRHKLKKLATDLNIPNTAYRFLYP